MMMSKMKSNTKDKNVSFTLTESNKFFTQVLDEIDSGIQNGKGLEHENVGQDYAQIFGELSKMKSPKERG